MPADKSLGALAAAATGWAFEYAKCQAKHAGAADAYDAARAKALEAAGN
jgi:hypothetical protein